MGELIKHGKVLMPQSMDRWGDTGPIFHRFLHGTRHDVINAMDYNARYPNAKKMNELATSTAVPYGILNTAK